MIRIERTDKFLTLRKLYPLFLAFLSCGGFSFGVYTACISEPGFFSMMRLAASGQVSIVRALSVGLLPFLISAIAVLLSKPYLLLPLTFLKSVFYGFCMYGICLEFSSAGWLVCMLLLFSDTFVLFSIHWFALRHRLSFSDSAFKELILLVSVWLSVCWVDATVISPFLAIVLNS